MTTTNDINETNAYKFSDNWRVETVAEPVNVFGCEHNAQEAEALAKWLEGEKGVKVRAVRNNPDRVRAAQQLRPEPFRFRFRTQAFVDMGLWQAAKQQ